MDDAGTLRGSGVRRGRALVAVMAGMGIVASATEGAPVLNATELHDKAMRVMETHCFSCHGPGKQKGDVRFDALESIGCDRQFM